MRNHIVIAVAAGVMTLTALAGNAAAEHRLGGGLHYLRGLGDINEGGFDEDAFSLLASYQYRRQLFSVEANLEYMVNFYGADDGAWQPQAYLLMGDFIYFGVGMGASHFNDRWTDPYYHLRLGVDVPVGRLHVDGYATYQFWGDDDLESLSGDDLDSITLAAVVRWTL